MERTTCRLYQHGYRSDHVGFLP